MTSLLTPQETLGLAQAGCISRLGAFVSTRALNQAAGVAEGLLLAPSGTAGQECVSPTTAALVAAGVGFSVFRPMSEDFDATHHYADNEAVALMEAGHMNVLAEGTVVANQPVFARHTSDGGSNTVLGKVRANSGGTVVIDTTSTVEGQYSVELFNGVLKEKFSYDTDGSAGGATGAPTTAQRARPSAPSRWWWVTASTSWSSPPRRPRPSRSTPWSTTRRRLRFRAASSITPARARASSRSA